MILLKNSIKDLLRIIKKMFHNENFALNTEFFINEFIKKREEWLLYFKWQILNLLTKNGKLWYNSGIFKTIYSLIRRKLGLVVKAAD